ncbi:MAG: phycobilisome protein [Microcoleaceae cyanobacterium]
MLTERAKTLIPKARIVSFEQWKGFYPNDIIARFQAADDESRYLTNQDLESLHQAVAASPELQQVTSSAQIDLAQRLRDQADTTVSQAREKVLAQYPGITEPGGDLYPEIRAKACWRDFWQFLRCVTYGIAAGQAQYTSAEGLHYMELLYQELKVPLQAMVSGIENLKTFSLQSLPTEQQQLNAPYFDHLISQLRQFNSA